MTTTTTTTRSRGPLWLLGAAFVVIIFGGAATQLVVDLSEGERPLALELVSHPPTPDHLRAFERELDSRNVLAEISRPGARTLQYVTLGDVGVKVMPGREGWLFYRPGVRYLVDPWPPRTNNVKSLATRTLDARFEDPVTIITSFRDQLADRGIHLLVVPAPGKPSVYPDRLGTHGDGGGAPVYAHTLDILGRLEREGVATVDLFGTYAAARDADPPPEAPYYLIQDTHWSPRGVRLAARRVAERLIELGFTSPGEVPYEIAPIPLERAGDIVDMMDLPLAERRYPPETVATERVIGPDGTPFESDPHAEILVLGDSFLRIYELDEPGSAGFTAHLARELGRPVAAIISDGGASTLVRQELSRKPDLLQGKRVVVWEFVERDIRFGSEGWQEVSLPPLD